MGIVRDVVEPEKNQHQTQPENGLQTKLHDDAYSRGMQEHSHRHGHSHRHHQEAQNSAPETASNFLPSVMIVDQSKEPPADKPVAADKSPIAEHIVPAEKSTIVEQPAAPDKAAPPAPVASDTTTGNQQKDVSNAIDKIVNTWNGTNPTDTSATTPAADTPGASTSQPTEKAAVSDKNADASAAS